MTEGGESKGEESGRDDFLLAGVSGSALCLFCFALVCVRNPEGGELSWRLGKVVPQLPEKHRARLTLRGRGGLILFWAVSGTLHEESVKSRESGVTLLLLSPAQPQGSLLAPPPESLRQGRPISWARRHLLPALGSGRPS